MSCLEFQTYFSSCITCQNFRPSCQAVSVPLHSGTLESCVESGWSLSSSLVSLFCMQCPICIVISRNASISDSLSVHHQQCDKFRKIQQESAKWTGTVILYGALHCLFAPCPPPPLKTRTTLLWGPEDHVHCEVDGVSTCGLAHSEKPPLHQRHLKKTNCWTLDLWMLVGPVAGVTPLARLQNLLRPQNSCRSGILLHNSRRTKPIKISGLGIGTRLS